MVTFLTILIFTAAFGVAAEYTLWRPERRAQAALANRLRTLRTQTARAPRSLLKTSRSGGTTLLQQMFVRLEVIKRLQDIIDQARLPYRAGNVVSFSLALLALGFLVADGIFVLPFVVLQVMFGMACAAVPYVYIWIKRGRRLGQIEGMLPDAIDLFTRAMRAGHNIHSGLQVLSEESHEPLSGEFRKLMEELALGSTLEQALHNLGDRVPLLDMRFFATGIILQRETGANIVTVMEGLSMVIRERLQLRSRLKAHTAQQRFSAGLLCGLPIFTGITFYFIRYDYISLLWLTPLGSKLLLYAIFSELIGILVIRKVGSIKL